MRPPPPPTCPPPPPPPMWPPPPPKPPPAFLASATALPNARSAMAPNAAMIFGCIENSSVSSLADALTTSLFILTAGEMSQFRIGRSAADTSERNRDGDALIVRNHVNPNGRTSRLFVRIASFVEKPIVLRAHRL